MLEPKVKSYVLNILEYKMFKDDIITRECSNGYTLKDEPKITSGTEFVELVFYKTPDKEPYRFDLFVKWSDEKIEYCYARGVTMEEMHQKLSRLLLLRNQYYRNTKFFKESRKPYPLYVRVE